MSILIKDSFQLTGDHIYTRNKLLIPEQRKFVRGELFEQLDDGYGKPMLKKIASNTVVVGGAILALKKLCNTDQINKWIPTAIDNDYGINNSSSHPDTQDDKFICLFGCGCDGAGLEFGEVHETSIRQRDVRGGLIPMRFQPAQGGSGGELTGEDAGKYHFKTHMAHKNTNGEIGEGMESDEGHWAWYLKEFDDHPTIKTMWKNSVDSDGDGSEIESDIDKLEDQHDNEGIETFVEFTLKLNTNDVREWFEANGGTNVARYNAFGFYTGAKGDDQEYHNVRLFSTVHFNNRDVSVRTTSTFIYRIYSLI